MFLGIDPGVRKLGYAIVDQIGSQLKVIDAGVIVDLEVQTVDRSCYYDRISQIFDFMTNILNSYQIDVLAIEKLFFTIYNQSNAEFVYAVRGMICMMAYRKQILILEPTPVQLKKAITGHAKANKELMISMIMRLYHLTDTPQYHDSADALGLALYACRLSGRA